MSQLGQAQALGFATMMGARAGHATRMGFTAPTILFEEIRAIDQDASRLDANVQRFVADPAFRASWASWLANWRAFAQRYLGSDWQKLGAAFYSDDLARQIETYRLQLQALYNDYARQAQPTGAAVPALTPPGPAAPPLVPGQTTSPVTGEKESLLPWWAWMGLGIGAVGLVYWGYRRASRALSGGARDVLPEPRYAYSPEPEPPISFARDYYPPSRHARIAPRRRDEALVVSETVGYAYAEPPPRYEPRTLAEYASDPRSQGIWYRPFEHPHLVPVAGDPEE